MTFHDLRGTACTIGGGRLYVVGAAMHGWTVTTVNQMLDTYQAMTRFVERFRGGQTRAKGTLRH